MKCAIAAFAKTPGLSPVKTRLTADIGQQFSETFYRMSVDAIKEVLLYVKSQSDEKIIPYWALAEINGIENKMWVSLPVIWTGEGGLGERLYSISKDLLKQYESVIMIGTDSPQLDPEIFLDVYYKLKISPDECIIGPCSDGGFYLFGSSFQIAENIWTDVKYSRSDTLEQLINKLEEAGIKYSLIKEMADADTLKDLKVISESLEVNKNKNLPAQNLLYTWIEDFLNKRV